MSRAIKVIIIEDDGTQTTYERFICYGFAEKSLHRAVNNIKDIEMVYVSKDLEIEITKNLFGVTEEGEK